MTRRFKNSRFFSDRQQIRIGETIGISAGTMGRELQGSAGLSESGVNAMISYSISQGFYGGISIDGKVLTAHNKENRRFYSNSSCSPRKILSGN